MYMCVCKYVYIIIVIVYSLLQYLDHRPPSQTPTNRDLYATEIRACTIYHVPTNSIFIGLIVLSPGNDENAIDYKVSKCVCVCLHTLNTRLPS